MVKKGFTNHQEQLALYAKAIGHPVRIAILQMLTTQAPCTHSEMAEGLPVAKSTLSQHLNELKEAGLIQKTNTFPGIKYHIDPEKWKAVQVYFTGLFRELPKAAKVKAVSVRKAGKKDIRAIKNLYKNTILNVNKNDYSPEQLKRWCDIRKNIGIWEEQVANQHFIVAERQGKITGFAAITPEGYLHSLFVHKDFQQQGIATILLEHIEKYARKNKIKQIDAEVSITAKPFFERKAYTTLTGQPVDIAGMGMTHFKMTKEIYGKEA